MSIPRRTIPGTDLSISLLAFGNFTFGETWWGEFTNEQAISLQNQAFDLGCNFFDTAPTYGNGRAEDLLAGTIQYAGAKNLVISTKFGYDIYTDRGDPVAQREKKQDFSAKFIRKDLEESLKRLGVSHIDLYQAHNIKLPQFQHEVFAAMEQLQKEGKIRYWGVALGSAIGWREEGHEAFLKHDAATVQTVMNMYEQDPGREICEIATARGRGGVIARVPTNSGILDEEFKSADHQFPPKDHRKFRDHHWLVYGLKKNEVIRPMAKKLGLTLRQFAYRWLASVPGLVAIEPNILSLQDVKDFIGAFAGSDVTLPAEMLEQITALYDADFHMGQDAHPCDWKSSTSANGKVRSSYQEPLVRA